MSSTELHAYLINTVGFAPISILQARRMGVDADTLAQGFASGLLRVDHTNHTNPMLSRVRVLF